MLASTAGVHAKKKQDRSNLILIYINIKIDVPKTDNAIENINQACFTFSHTAISKGLIMLIITHKTPPPTVSEALL